MDFAEVGEKKKPKKEKVEGLTPFPIVHVQRELEVYKPKLAELEKQAKELKVTDQETFQISIDGAGTAKGFIKAINGRKEEWTKAYREFTNKVGNLASVFTGPMKKVAEEFSRKSGDYQYQLELAEKKKQKLIEEANAKLQADLNKQAEKDGVEAPVVVPVKAPKATTTIHTAGGHSQHLRKEWKAEIENGAVLVNMLKAFKEDVQKGKLATKTNIISRIDQILSFSEYYVFDQKLINQAVRMGVRAIQGIRIYEKAIPVHR